MSDTTVGGNDTLIAGTAIAGSTVSNSMWSDAQTMSGSAIGGQDTFVFKDTATQTVGTQNFVQDFSQAHLIDADAAWLRLTYTARPTDYRVRLVATQPTYGGRRWWFLCPLARKDGGPARRVAKHYLPPGGW